MQHDEQRPEDSTGECSPTWKLRTVPFDRFRITVKLTPDDRFVEIVEVGFRKDFRSPQDKARSQGYHDVSDLYDE